MPNLKPYKTVLKFDVCEAIITLINSLHEFKYEDDNDKIVVAALEEVRVKLSKRIITYQTKYTVSFTPAQALAMRILYTDFLTGTNNQLGNRLRMIADEVHKHFAQ